MSTRAEFRKETMKVDLNKEECEFLILAMQEAIGQADEEIGRVARTANHEEKSENLRVRGIFTSIQSKMMDAVVNGRDTKPEHDTFGPQSDAQILFDATHGTSFGMK